MDVWYTVIFQALSDAGIECNYVTGGGTGTYLYEAASGVFTEVQPVSFHATLNMRT